MYNDFIASFIDTRDGWNSVFDLYLLPLKLADGQEINEMPGLLAATAPRRCDRSRSGDLLLALLTLAGTAPVEPGVHEELFEKLVSAYYRTRGTITAGLREAVGQLNEQLTRRNLRERGSSQRLVIVNIAVLRRDILYLAQSGDTHSLLITKDDFTRFSDPESGGRGIGIGRSFNLRFWQARVEKDDLLLFATLPPTGWTAETLSGSTRLTLDQFRRRLMSHSGTEVEAGVIQFKPGEGQVHRLRPRQSLPAPDNVEALPIEPPKREEETFTPPLLDRQHVAAPAPEKDEFPQEETPLPQESGQEEIWSEPRPVAHDEAIYRSAAQEPERTYRSPGDTSADGIYIGDASPRSPSPEPEVTRQPVKLPEIKMPPVNIRKPLASVWRAGKSARRKVDTGSRVAAERLLPDRSTSLSTGAMLFIAIAVPLMIVAIAVTVYLYAPSGRSEQQQAYIAQAIVFLENASAQPDAVLKRNNLDQVITWVDKAEEYGRTNETIEIRRQVRTAIDVMDGVTRLPLEPAIIGGLPSGTRVTRIVASTSEVFLLDAEAGKVLRLLKTATGYELDNRFNCGPGPSGELIISPLVDMQLLPSTSAYSILAVDRAGNLAYCVTGKVPTTVQLPPPDPNWGSISAMTIEKGILYLLDKPNNRIWLYVGDQDFSYSGEPRLFFNDEVPQLFDVVDMAANNEDLYLLHEDGTMTTCIFRSFSFAQTRCSDVTNYNDMRPGRTMSVSRIPDTQFIQMQTTAPPDPSLYILDAAGPTVYHFSLRLNLQNQFSPDPDIQYAQPGKQPGAFTISSNRIIYLAIGNQVYYAPLSY
jgi:hypothetical protein